MKDILIITLGRLVTAGLSVASLRVITEMFSPAEYGFYTILIVFQVFCGLFLINPFGQYLNRNTHEWYECGCLNEKLLSYNYYILFFSVIGALSVFWWSFFSSTITSSFLAAFAIFAIVYTGTWNATLIPLLNMLTYRKSAVICSIITSSLALLLSSLLARIFGSAFSWLLGQSIALLVGSMVAFFIYKRHLKNKNATNHGDKTTHESSFITMRGLKLYVAPLAFSTMLLWFQSSGYRFVIERIYGLELLGLLAVGFGLANQLFGVAESLLMQILNPVFYRRISTASLEQGKLALCDLMSLLLPIYFLMASVLLACASPLLTILVSKEYHNAVIFFYSGVMIELFRVVNSLISNAAQLEMKMSKLISPNGLSCCVLIVIIMFSYNFDLTLELSSLFYSLSGICAVIASTVKMRKYISPAVINSRVIFSFLLLCVIIISTFVNKTPLIESNTILSAIFIIGTCFALSGVILFVLYKGYKPFSTFFCSK
ncbi:lipopolysaccharide biosynthesis protein [Aeromonas veronii]|uniref:lipopolysaccharide biosynthesis protein n=1 Tax=Aeromonas veronii TaxID=654 RepID=UPI003DA348F3